MANTVMGTGTHKRKETYANEVLTIARLETNIYDDFSTDYEKDEVTGEIKVPTRNGDVKLSDYDIKNGIELTQSATDYINLPVDIDYGMNELIDGYEADAVPDNLRAQRIESAGYAVGMKKETMAISKLLSGGTVSSDTTECTEQTVYKKIAKEIKNMKKRGMKPANMRVAISAETELLLLTDEKFSNTASTIGAELVREGVIGKVAGVATKPNYLMGDDVEFIIYDKRFCQKYEVWKVEPTINNLADGRHIGASALQGRQVGGLAVTNALGVQIKYNRSQTPEETSYTVTYNVNGGTGTIEAVEVTAGESITLNDGTGITAPEGKKFTGWAKSASAQSATVTSPFTPTSNTTLYAVYTTE